MRKREDEELIPSGIELLGKMPIGWEINKIGRVVKFFTGATPPTGDTASYEGDKMWANISDLGSRYICRTSKTISETAAKKANILESPTNSLLFSFKLSLGKVSIVKQPMYSNEAIATFLGNDGIEINWAYYAFPVFIPMNSKINIYGSPLLNADLINSAKIMVPPLDEQQSIAVFLDTETGKVDNFVDELTKLKGKLEAQRKSLISECVTKGIPDDRDREYKDSGVEWLGEIPVEWGLRPFGKSVVLISKKIKSTQNRISLDMIQSGNGAISSNEENDFVGDGVAFAGGDVLFGKLRPYLNKSYYAESHGDAFGDIHVYRPNEDVAGKYLFYFTLMDGFVKEANRTASGVKMPRASWGNITKFAFTLPSLPEQQKIADYLDFECVKINSLTGEIDNQISLLKTYRKSLINEVVTGKVEV